jgi:hypothetical protein
MTPEEISVFEYFLFYYVEDEYNLLNIFISYK